MTKQGRGIESGDGADILDKVVKKIFMENKRTSEQRT